MRKVLIKSWIPAEYTAISDGVKRAVPGTGCMSKEFDTEATFESWGTSYDTQNDCNGNISVMQFTVAIVILSDGTLEEVSTSNMKFVIDEKQQKIEAAAPELLEALNQVLGYEHRCASKGNPMIGNGILSIIHEAIKKATD